MRPSRSSIHLLLNKTNFSTCSSSIHISNLIKSNPTSSSPTGGGGGNWASLTAALKSTPLTPPLIDSVLLHLREPPHALKALAFFHWCASKSNLQMLPHRHGPRAYALMINILVRAGLLRDAHALLDSAVRSEFPVVEMIFDTYSSVVPGSRVFDLLVQTYVRFSMVLPAFDACKYVVDRGFVPTLISFNELLRKAQRLSEFELAWKVFEFMLERRVYPNKATYEVMVDLLCKEGSLNKVTDVVGTICGKKGGPPGTYVNVALLLRIIRDGRIDRGTVLLRRMLQKDMVSDSIYHSLIIFAHCQNGDLSLTYEQLEDMVKRGARANAFVYTCLIGANCKAGDLDKATRLFHEMVSVGMRPYDETYNHLIVGCCSRKDRHGQALYYCEKMIHEGFLPDIFTCKELFSALGSNGDVNKANDMLTVMIEKGFVPDEKIYVQLIEGYGSIGDVNGVLKTYYEMEYMGITLDIEVFDSLIRNLCACGVVNEAEKFMGILRKRGLTPNESMYGVLINGFCDKGQINSALHWFNEMQGSLLVPSGDVFMKLAECVITKGKPAV